jgi:RNA polymerase sigma factor (TIGR02999 family)
MEKQIPDITQFLQLWGAGDPRALEQVIPLVYQQLRAIAENQMRRERAGHTLQATALVNELYLRLGGQHGSHWTDRGHFFRFAAMMMRRILIDYAKQAQTGKRGGGLERVPLSDEVPWLGSSGEEVLALDRALGALEESDARKARVVELRVLLGCTATEAAEILEVSKATADREWTLAKAWLFRELKRGGGWEAGG